MTKFSLDLDGTILEFYRHYIEYFGEPRSDSEITKKVTGVLRQDSEFWYTQPVINMPNFVPHAYCTARIIPKQWIRKQLAINNLPDAPVYQVRGVSLTKYFQVKRSGSECHVDDSLQVFLDLNRRGIPCLLMDSPSNQEWGPIGRVYSLNIEELESTYDLFMNTIFPHFRELL